MKQVLIIPDRNNLEAYMGLAEKYGLGFEYNDFFMPDLLDDAEQMQEITARYRSMKLPPYCTMHGDFFDVIPFSPDKRIRETAELRIRQSIDAAKAVGAKAVVFHTNYNPFLNSEAYVKNWIETNALFWGGILEKHPEINIYLENMFDTAPDILAALSERLSHFENYGVCFDYAHALLSGKTPEEWAKCLGSFVKHIHINDNDGISDLHLAWGDGVVDRQNFYTMYNTYFNGATVLLETTGKENIVRSLQMLREEGFLNNERSF